MDGRYKEVLMLRKMLSLLLFLFFLYGFFAIPDARACGHEGLYAGIGYMQLLMYTPEYQLNPNISSRVNFGPGFGAAGLLGYDFEGSRWGIQMPFEFSRLKLNMDEWVNYFGSTLEAVFHIKEWSSGFDFHLVGGVGWAYLSEGEDYDNSRNAGITASLGPGFSYYFTRTEKVSGAVSLEIPFRYVYFFGNHLSANGTSVAAFPIRLTMQIGF